MNTHTSVIILGNTSFDQITIDVNSFIFSSELVDKPNNFGLKIEQKKFFFFICFSGVCMRFFLYGI